MSPNPPLQPVQHKFSDNIAALYRHTQRIVPAIAHYLATYRTLSRREQIVLLVSMVLLPLFWLGLRLAGLQRFQAWIERPISAASAPLSQTEAAGLGLAVNRAASRILGPSCCLTRSLLLWWLLRRYGQASDLCIGVRFEEGQFLAHAWVEQHGVPINDCPESIARYAAFDQPLSPAAFS